MWQLIREVASLLDPARANDVQMLGLSIEVSARSGDVVHVINKATAIEDAHIDTEPDDV